MATIVITPPKKFAIPKVSELWEAREVLYRFGARDVTLRYRQTLLGVMWVVLQPLLTALIFVLVFAQVANLTYNGIKPIVFIFAGVTAWNLFSGIITRAQTSLVSNRDLVSKVFFPRMLVPLAVVYSCLVDFAVSVGFLIVLMVIFGVNPGVAVLLAPVWTVMILLMASGVGTGDGSAHRAASGTSTTSSLPPAVPALRQPHRVRHPERACQVAGGLRPESADLAAPGVPVVPRARPRPRTLGDGAFHRRTRSLFSSAGRSSSSRWSAASPTSI